VVERRRHDGPKGSIGARRPGVTEVRVAPVRRLAGVPLGATAEEVAAIVAALAVIDAEDRARRAAAADGEADRIDAWVRAARMSNRGSGYTRGPWRLAGRLPRRKRA
jgi:hypothetical protein